MATYTQNMSEGRPSSLIIKFALPLMTGNIFQDRKSTRLNSSHR